MPLFCYPLSESPPHIAQTPYHSIYFRYLLSLSVPHHIYRFIFVQLQVASFYENDSKLRGLLCPLIRPACPSRRSPRSVITCVVSSLSLTGKMRLAQTF